MTCRIRSIDCSGPGRSDLPFTVAANCGWAASMRQGELWPGSAARQAWLAHRCQPTRPAAVGGGR